MICCQTPMRSSRELNEQLGDGLWLKAVAKSLDKVIKCANLLALGGFITHRYLGTPFSHTVRRMHGVCTEYVALHYSLPLTGKRNHLIQLTRTQQSIDRLFLQHQSAKQLWPSSLAFLSWLRHGSLHTTGGLVDL